MDFNMGDVAKGQRLEDTIAGFESGSTIRKNANATLFSGGMCDGVGYM